MTEPPAWERWLKDRYLPYLLPKAMHEAVPVEVAERFMGMLTGSEAGLELLRWRSLLVAHSASLLRLVDEDLPALCRVLPSRSEAEVRRSRGGFLGRPDVVATQRLWLGGDREIFVGRGRRRAFDLPEVVLVRWVVERLLGGLERMRARLPNQGDLLAAALDREGPLRDLLDRTPLRQVAPAEVLGMEHHRAARADRHPAFHHAQRWARRIEQALWGEDPEALARMLAEGALTALEAPKRFELAVLLRLVEALAEALDAGSEGGPWRLEPALLEPGRADLVSLHHRPTGARLRFYYDQAILPPGPRDAAVLAYFGVQGRLRPDWTLRIEAAGAPARHVVGEVKLTQDRGYAIQGLHEAMLYAMEYAQHLNDWPRAILTTTAAITGPPSRAHGVVAEGWEGWPSPETVEGILRGALTAGASQA